MQWWEWIVVAVAIVVLVALAASFARIRRRRSHLRERFGTEYNRAVATEGTAAGEKRLRKVERERDALEVIPVTRASRERYLEEWRQVEARFVSDPRESARGAERVVARALTERGYPAPDDSEERAAVVAVDHADVAERYRHAYAMLSRVDGAESTESLRKAMLDFRAVLDELLEDKPAAARSVVRASSAGS